MAMTKFLSNLLPTVLIRSSLTSTLPRRSLRSSSPSLQKKGQRDLELTEQTVSNDVLLSSSSFQVASKNNFDDEEVDESVVNNVYSWLSHMRDDGTVAAKDLWQNLRVADHHHVFVLQPFERRTDLPHRVQLRLDECVGLVRTLNWTVADARSVGRTSSKTSEMPFGTVQVQSLNAIATKVKASAIFVSVNNLTSLERVQLELNFDKRPVYDRFSLVLQIFRRHASSAEAKLQLSMAELPYVMRRLDEERDPTRLVTGRTMKNDKNKDYYERRQFALKKAINSIKNKIGELKRTRQRDRESRQRFRVPTVAVVGYTNGGKTSLIRALTQDERVVPANKLFATLDVTTHKAHLPSTRMETLFIDTVGFISDLPSELLPSFSATLEDMLVADLIVHVRDLSHPDTDEQCRVVMETLKRINIPSHMLNNVVTVGNKIDQVDCQTLKRIDVQQLMPISATKGLGLRQLALEIESLLINITGREVKTFRCRTHSKHFSWLMANVNVIEVKEDRAKNNHVLIKTLLKPGDLQRFHKNCELL